MISLALSKTKPRAAHDSDRPRSRELGAQVGDVHLEERFGLSESVQRVAAEASEGDAFREAFSEGSMCRRGEKDLATVTRVANARGDVDRDPDVARVGERRPAGVHADPDTHVRLLRPGLIAEPSLDREGGLKRVRRPAEDPEEFVGSGIDLETAGRADARPDRRPDIAEQAGGVIAEPPPG